MLRCWWRIRRPCPLLYSSLYPYRKHVELFMASPAQDPASGDWRNRRRYIREVESPSAEVADVDKFRCSGVPIWQAMSLRLQPIFKFFIGAEDSDDLRLRLGLCVWKRRGSTHILG
jgi:hypothetical protein